jgi:hypothetical protein
MANVAHASLTGSNLHEPKGADTAVSGAVYVADGGGSGAWTTITGLSFTGMVADFLTPIAPSGWLELNGAAISTTTYAALYTAVTIQQTGTRVNGLAVITGLASTANIKVGYYVFGTGISSGTTVLSVDSPNQITMSGNASSSGSATVVVSPWLLNTGTITLPDTTTAGRFRRSRSAAKQIGVSQADTFKFHTHSGTATSDGAHTHAVTIHDTGHTHGGVGVPSSFLGSVSPGGPPYYVTSGSTGSQTTGITATIDTAGGSHTHTLAIDAQGGDADTNETRPVSLVLMTCVKT